MVTKCPGRDSRQVSAVMVVCRRCRADLEMFSDESRRNCPRCGASVLRERELSCAAWCSAARECTGEGLFRRQNNKGGE